MNTEKAILSGLVHSTDFISRALPYLSHEYFHDEAERLVFERIKEYVEEYATTPSKVALQVEVGEDNTEAFGIVGEIYQQDPTDYPWLLEEAQSFCRDKALFNAINQAIEIYDGTNDTFKPEAIPGMLEEALGVSFDQSIGLDFEDDAESRYEYYTSPEARIPFRVSMFNEITDGGVLRKTLNILIMGVNAGKTLSMISLGADYIRDGYNVLYITGEMSEHEIMKRFDANLLDVPINEVIRLAKGAFLDRVKQLFKKTHGKLKVKEYPTGNGNTNHFKSLIRELKLKKKFAPDVIFVDYLGIIASSRMKMGAQSSYFYLKAIAEELRALAVEHDVVIWSAMQFNRQGMANTDAEMTDTAESMGVPQTVDFMLAGTRTEELDSVGQILWKQLKNRYASRTVSTRFVTGVDLEKQKVYSVENSGYEDESGKAEKEYMTSKTDTRSKMNGKFSDLDKSDPPF